MLPLTMSATNLIEHINLFFNPDNLLAVNPPYPSLSLLQYFSSPDYSICHINPKFYSTAEGSHCASFYYVFKPIDALQSTPGLSQIDASLFSLLFIYLSYYKYRKKRKEDSYLNNKWQRGFQKGTETKKRRQFK